MGQNQVAHEHSCAHCGKKFPCAINCDDMQDGENVCGPCAEARFDAIKPLERILREEGD